MKKTLIILITALLLISATACSKTPSAESLPVSGQAQAQVEPAGAVEAQTQVKSADKEPAPAEGKPQTGVIRLDFSNGVPHGDFLEETFQSYSESITDEELINALSDISGLDFKATISREDEDLIVVDWSADSTLITGLKGRKQKEDFTFEDDDSMRWFMMDSMWRTLGSGEDIYFSMDGGKELVFDKLFPVDFIPIDVPYMGSAFYYEHAGVSDDFSYTDGKYNFVLRYPSSFAPEPEDTGSPIMTFPSYKDNTVLKYWVIPNSHGETPEVFAQNAPAEETNIYENTVMGWVNDINQENGEITPTAYFWLVEDDWIACAAINCETEEQASRWHSKIVVEDAILIEKIEYNEDNEENGTTISEQDAMDILCSAIDMAEGTAVVSYGEEVINGVQCHTFAYGKDTPEKFTAEVHYAVTDEGKILVFDFVSNEYKEL